MQFPEPLIPARLQRRYKRFLADVTLPNGETATVHCPNPGAMLGLDQPGSRIWLKSGRGKLPFGWVLSETETGHLVGIDTTLPNRLVAEALAAGRIPDLAGYDEIRPEVAYGARSRVDFRLRHPGRPDIYLEVKNAHLMRSPGLAEFPDCVTARGARHLHDLAAETGRGARAVMLFVVQRTDCSRFSLAGDLDPAYATAFREARNAGVEALCYATAISRTGIALDGPLPFAEPRHL